MRKKTAYLRKGSYTVEAALLMPILLTVTFSLLYLTFFVHNRTWFAIAAYEAAMDGSMRAVQSGRSEGESAARQKAGERCEKAFFSADGLTVSVQMGVTKTEVEYQAAAHVFPAGFLWNFSVKGSSRMIDPVLYIRMQRQIGS